MIYGYIWLIYNFIYIMFIFTKACLCDCLIIEQIRIVTKFINS